MRKMEVGIRIEKMKRKRRKKGRAKGEVKDKWRVSVGLVDKKWKKSERGKKGLLREEKNCEKKIVRR